MTSLQADLVGKSAGDLESVLPLFESLERSMTRFHEHQAETLKVHQRYLETQESCLIHSCKMLLEVRNRSCAITSCASIYPSYNT